MEAFDGILEANFNVLPSNNKLCVADQDPTNMMDLPFEDEVFKANSDWFIDNEAVLQEDHY